MRFNYCRVALLLCLVAFLVLTEVSESAGAGSSSPEFKVAAARLALHKKRSMRRRLPLESCRGAFAGCRNVTDVWGCMKNTAETMPNGTCKKWVLDNSACEIDARKAPNCTEVKGVLQIRHCLKKLRPEEISEQCKAAQLAMRGGGRHRRPHNSTSILERKRKRSPGSVRKDRKTPTE